MKDKNKTKKQLIDELTEMRQRIAQLEVLETNRKQTKEALKNSVDQFRNLMDYIPGISIQGYKIDGTVFYWNKASEKVYGYTAEEAIGKNLGDLIVPPDLKSLFKECLELGKKVKKSGEFMPPGELLLLHKEGHLVPVYSIHTAVYIDDIEPLLFCIDVDLSERKKAEEALRESEYKFRSLFDLSPQAIALTEVETGRIIDVNDRFCELTKYDKKDVLGRTTPESGFYSEDDRNNFVKELRARGEVQGLEMDFEAKDGSILNALMFSKIIQLGGKPFVLTIFFDMTDHKRAEEKLRESKEKYRILFDQAADLIAIIDIQGNFLDLNRKFEEESGWNRNVMIGKNVFTSGIITEASAQKVSFHLSQLFLGKEPPIFEIDGIKKDGGIVPYELRATPITKDNKTVSVQAILRNITERKQAEEILKHNEEKYRSLVESTEDSIYLIDRNYTYLFMNKKHISRLGLSGDEYLGQTFSKFHSPDETKWFVEKANLVFTTGESIQHEHKSLKDGRYFFLTLSPVKKSDGTVIAVTVISKDITEIKRMEEKLHILSLTDELTGLYNRRGFFTLVEQLLKMSKRQKKGIFMLYVDLDALKAINDTFGHQEGDLALIDTANILKENYRESDIIARIGGDEFVVIPVGTTEDSIEIITTRLQKAVEVHNSKSNRSYKLSLSAGIAYYDPEHPCSIDDLLVQGDKSMYEQKRHKYKS